MNAYLIIGVAVVVAFFTLWWFLYRLYKRIGRRCRKKNCGRTGVKRVSKILFPPDDPFISWRSGEGKLRWWIRRPIKLTFTVCKCGWVELVKIDTDPISLWHAYWVKGFHKEQYSLEGWPLIEATQRKLRQLYLSDAGRCPAKSGQLVLNSQASDTPLISLDSLFRDFFEEVEEIIGNDSDEHPEH